MNQRKILKLGYSFGSPLNGSIELLDNALDCYSGNPKGLWKDQPRLEAPLLHYKACKEILETVQRTQPNMSSVGEYILLILSTIDSESSSLLKIVLSGEEK